jgi:membrane fusion protein (multidrug efflux system)
MTILADEKKREAAAKRKGGILTTRNLVLLAALAVGLAVGVPTWWNHHNHESTDDAQLEGHILAVMPRVGGYVEKIHVSDEQAVKAGDTLFTLDRRELEIKERQAEAELMAAQAAAKGGVAGAGARAAESQKTTAQANLEAARATLDKTTQDLERMRQLSKQDIASKSQLEAAEAAHRSAQAAFAAASEQAKGSAYTIEGANAQVRAADARLAETQAALDAARLQLSYAVVTAAATGHVAKKNLEPGQLVSPGQPVMSIVDASPLWVVANFKETQLQRLRLGQSVEIGVDAYPKLQVRGEVASIQYATGARFSLLPPDNATGNFTKVVQRVPVKIRLTGDTDESLLRPGMSVSVSVDVKSGT